MYLTLNIAKLAFFLETLTNRLQSNRAWKSLSTTLNSLSETFSISVGKGEVGAVQKWVNLEELEICFKMSI